MLESFLGQCAPPRGNALRAPSPALATFAMADSALVPMPNVRIPYENASRKAYPNPSRAAPATKEAPTSPQEMLLKASQPLMRLVATWMARSAPAPVRPPASMTMHQGHWPVGSVWLRGSLPVVGVGLVGDVEEWVGCGEDAGGAARWGSTEAPLGSVWGAMMRPARTFRGAGHLPGAIALTDIGEVV